MGRVESGAVDAEREEIDGRNLRDVTTETMEWGAARLAELEERFGITDKSLVARELGISEDLAKTLVEHRKK